jgi:hypothetical protein
LAEIGKHLNEVKERFGRGPWRATRRPKPRRPRRLMRW